MFNLEQSHPSHSRQLSCVQLINVQLNPRSVNLLKLASIPKVRNPCRFQLVLSPLYIEYGWFKSEWEHENVTDRNVTDSKVDVILFKIFTHRKILKLEELVKRILAIHVQTYATLARQFPLFDIQ